jgi:hypothetical protein
MRKHGDIMSVLTRRCFRLGSSLWNYRRPMLREKFTLDKVVFVASLKGLRGSCLELTDKINALLRKDAVAELERVNKDFSLVMCAGANGQVKLRYSIEKKLGDALRLRPGDRLVMKITDVERKPSRSKGRQ